MSGTSAAAFFMGARQLVDALPDGVVVVDGDGVIVGVNARLLDMTGHAETDLLGHDVEVLVPLGRRAAHAAFRTRFTAHAGVRTIGTDLNIVALRKDGTTFSADIALSPLTLPGGLHVVAAIRDATARREVEHARRATEERFRLLVEGAVGHAIVMLDADGCVESWNIGAERLNGYSAEEITGRHVSVFHTADDVAAGKARALLAEAAAAGRAEDFGWRLRKDGSRFQASVIVTALRDGGRLRGFSEMTRDISAALQARDDLERLHLLEQQERLGRDLHDGVIQSVFAVGMSLQALLSRVDDATVADRLTQSIRALDDTITELRTFIFGLRTLLTPEAIRREIDRLVDEARGRSDVEITGVIDSNALTHVGDHAQDLLLVAREALSNVQRHSRARRCELTVRDGGGSVELVVRDDGRGFDTSAPTAGLGLRNARSRAGEIGADYTVESSSAGTTVRFRLPPGS